MNFTILLVKFTFPWFIDLQFPCFIDYELNELNELTPLLETPTTQTAINKAIPIT